MKWSIEEEDKLRELYGKMSAVELEKVFNKAADSIRQKARRMGLGVITLWTKEEEEKLKKLYANHSNNELAKIFKRNRRSVLNKAMLLKLKKPGERLENGRKYYFNEDYFKKESNNMYYILGFLYGNGNIANKKQITIHTQERDEEILKKILKEMEANLAITTSKKSKIVNFYSEKMYDDLIKLGLVEFKSSNLNFPFWIDEKYMSDFIRGYFDGNGSVYAKRRNVVICGNKKFLEDMGTILEKNGIGITGIYKHSGCNCYELCIVRKSEVYNFCNFIYSGLSDGDLWLKRKKDILWG